MRLSLPFIVYAIAFTWWLIATLASALNGDWTNVRDLAGIALIGALIITWQSAEFFDIDPRD